jgi:hypothetical protein
MRLSSALGRDWIWGLVGQTEPALARYDVEYLLEKENSLYLQKMV